MWLILMCAHRLYKCGRDSSSRMKPSQVCSVMNVLLWFHFTCSRVNYKVLKAILRQGFIVVYFGHTRSTRRIVLVIIVSWYTYSEIISTKTTKTSFIPGETTEWCSWFWAELVPLGLKQRRAKRMLNTNYEDSSLLVMAVSSTAMLLWHFLSSEDTEDTDCACVLSLIAISGPKQ